jgi:1-aminocyclopropane-1-carboxylate deaminase
MIISPLQQIHHPVFNEHHVEVWIKRDDLIHRYYGGNKWRKLMGYFNHFKENNYTRWSTMGGPWSNHLYAFAAFSKEYKIPSKVFVRGNDFKELSLTLQFVQSCGTEIVFLTRKEYQELKDSSLSITSSHDELFIPEGGSGEMGEWGCREIYNEIKDSNPSLICVPTGTQTTFHGICSGSNFNVLGFSALKGYHSEIKINNHIHQITDEFCRGGYAKTDSLLFDFIISFYKEYSIILDPVYTSKMMIGVFEMIKRGDLDGHKIIAVHTGGIQGIFGYPELKNEINKINPDMLANVYRIEADFG